MHPLQQTTALRLCIKHVFRFLKFSKAANSSLYGTAELFIYDVIYVIQWLKCVCSVLSRILHNLKISLHILGIPKLRTNLEIVQHKCAIPRSSSGPSLNFSQVEASNVQLRAQQWALGQWASTRWSGQDLRGLSRELYCQKQSKILTQS